MTTVQDQMWVEKYRPDTLADVRGNKDIIDRLTSYADDPSMPNLLFAGPAGTGKTTAATALAKDKYGDEWQDHFMQLNASDDRGIDTVREEIKDFARLSTISEHEWKIVFLDEADHLTRDAQPAMRRVMEDYHDRTRFILSCNWPNKLIDPIQSRCTTLRLSQLDQEIVVEMMAEICDNEDVDYTEDQLQSIAKMADGDTRTAIHTLQSAVIDGEVDDVVMESLLAYPDPEQIDNLFQRAIRGDHDVMEEIDSILSDGVDEQQLLNEFLDAAKRSDIPADAKMKVMDKIGETEWRIINGSNPNVQFNALVANLRVARHLSLEPYRSENNEE